jgi:hypothetical protein
MRLALNMAKMGKGEFSSTTRKEIQQLFNNFMPKSGNKRSTEFSVLGLTM